MVDGSYMVRLYKVRSSLPHPGPSRLTTLVLQPDQFDLFVLTVVYKGKPTHHQVSYMCRTVLRLRCAAIAAHSNSCCQQIAKTPEGLWSINRKAVEGATSLRRVRACI